MDQFFSNFAHTFIVSNSLPLMYYQGRVSSEQKKHSFTCAIEIIYLTSRFYSNIVHKFIVENYAIFIYALSNPLLHQGQDPGVKFSFRFLIEITYLTTRFFSNVAHKFIVSENPISCIIRAGSHQGQGFKVKCINFSL